VVEGKLRLCFRTSRYISNDRLCGFYFIASVELGCEANAFSHLSKSFVPIPPSHKAEQHRRKARMLEERDLARSTRSKRPKLVIPEQITSKPRARRKDAYGAGIKNLGATCYAASALQVAFCISSWREVIYEFII
jgi:hypothetical protein